MRSRATKITVKALQSLLTRIGSNSSGSKAVLGQRFNRDVRTSRLFDLHPQSVGQQDQPYRRVVRIVSIDMGIKNLAFCNVKVQYLSKDNLNAKMEILEWKKIDLAKTGSANGRNEPDGQKIKVNNGEEKEGQEQENEEQEDVVDIYTSSVLSATAYTLVKNMILISEPDIILIEKQRWRSGGSSAVLQWTIRVNTLEAMLWAILTTLRAEHQASLQRPGQDKKGAVRKEVPCFEVFAVDPKRVGQYWLGQSRSTEDDGAVQGRKKLSKSKAEKKAKIAILRDWLSTAPASTGRTTLCHDSTIPTIDFELSQQVEPIRQALCSSSKPVQRHSNSSSKIQQRKQADESGGKTNVTSVELKKLDDVTDCLLQVAAWVSWESNRLQLREMIEAKRRTTVKRKKDGGSEEKMESNQEILREILGALNVIEE